MNAHVLPRLVLLATIVATLSAPTWADGWGHIPDPLDRSLACASTTAGDVYAFPNTPSTFCQCMGCGVGAGYHAPLVFNPVPTWRRNHHGVMWRSAPPMPPSCGYQSCNDQMFGPEMQMSSPAVPLPLHHHRHELTPPANQLFSAPGMLPSAPMPNRDGAGPQQMPGQEPDSPSESAPSNGA